MLEGPLLTFGEALDTVLCKAKRLGTESVPLAVAAARALAERVVADLDVPPFDTTAMDGWAVASGWGATLELTIAGTLAAGGRPEGPLQPGTALKVMTGAPVPPNCYGVVPVEDAKELPENRVRLLVSPRDGSHIRRRGEIVAKGAALLVPGRLLGPADLVLAASAGRAQLEVIRRPRVGVLVTGDEVVDPPQAPKPGEIRNTNGPFLTSALRTWGASVVELGIVSDEPALLSQALANALNGGLDLLLTSGGVSAGDYDLVSESLVALGAQILFHKVAIRPAKPLLFAVHGNTLVFGLPGNPVSAAVAFDLFVRPALRVAWGLTPPLPEPETAILTGPVANKGLRLAFHPAELRLSEGRLVARPVASKGSHDIVAHAEANGYLVLQPETAHAAGERVECYPRAG